MGIGYGRGVGDEEYFPPEEESRYDFLEKITEVESIVGRSGRRIEPAAQERLDGVISSLRTVLSSRTASAEDFARWKGMLSLCLEEHVGVAETPADTGSAEALYRCLGEIERGIDASG
jgi:hypothetical protein